jgi:hypothetical protein
MRTPTPLLPQRSVQVIQVRAEDVVEGDVVSRPTGIAQRHTDWRQVNGVLRGDEFQIPGIVFVFVFGRIDEARELLAAKPASEWKRADFGPHVGQGVDFDRSTPANKVAMAFGCWACSRFELLGVQQMQAGPA